ncbi:MAG: DUF1292 domain-containing protein [Lachnospiraceae bacterium]|jgi:uncharacterized protein YrzB (UPF0473 family)|nr:DUF1292 domain-containing protein [Lachnospiraceae bacterium]
MGYDENSKQETGQNEDHDTITLTFDDGTEAECIVWGFVEVDGKSYISLLPMEDDEDEEEGGCYLYQYDENEDGEPVLGYIEDDAVLEKVIDAFDTLFDEEESEYDEIVPGEDL